jgi:DNA polymerase V
MIVVAGYEGKWVCRQLLVHGKKKYLTTAKEHEPVIEVNEQEGILIFGVVTWSCCPQMEVKKYVRTRRLQ